MGRSRSPSRERRSRSKSGGRRSRSLERNHRGRSSRSSSPKTNTVAVFNLSYRSDEREIERIFERYGPIKKCNVVGGRNSHRSSSSTGFAFITFERMDDCKEAKEDAHGMEIDGNIIRTDYCISDGQRRKRRDFYVSPDRAYRRRRSRSYERSYRRSHRSRSREDRRRRSPSPYSRRRRSRS
ncbi:Oidioi.mRNA.OKI2018_I69.chr2.g6692.t1.cds [Oikopleura dioica]|uniref:Oidioi.mRNA.OKI2018_I69.chr2.g6692.t1.cds n=1 Tax=Oikopleura dioica TaxID=34765 RepID=A0ABN7T8L8_OIKDI|nr:Oidioi.mRNA.OKI2018_I69.chr2.g6692.t1.cds [Oikopleura dioica]